MKISKINIKFLALTLGLVALSSCTDDDLSGLDPLEKPTATTTVTSLTLAEGESATIPFTISRAITKPSQFKVELVGSGADESDFTAGNPTDADTGAPGIGYEITVPAYATSFEIPVDVILDLDQTEGTETVTLKISAAGVRTILTPAPYLIKLTITDFEYCMWTLQVVDDYGDSWQGGQVVLTQDGVSTAYPDADWDDDEETYQIPVGNGAAFSFEYISGTTGTSPNQPGAPAYEEEDSYTLTSPSGAVYTGGVSPADGVTTPTVGIIVSGTNNCN